MRSKLQNPIRRGEELINRGTNFSQQKEAASCPIYEALPPEPRWVGHRIRAAILSVLVGNNGCSFSRCSETRLRRHSVLCRIIPLQHQHWMIHQECCARVELKKHDLGFAHFTARIRQEVHGSPQLPKMVHWQTREPRVVWYGELQCGTDLLVAAVLQPQSTNERPIHVEHSGWRTILSFEIIC